MNWCPMAEIASSNRLNFQNQSPSEKNHKIRLSLIVAQISELLSFHFVNKLLSTISRACADRLSIPW